MLQVRRALDAGTQFQAVDFVAGERIAGNPFWYCNADGDFVWAGATDAPIPATPQAI